MAERTVLLDATQAVIEAHTEPLIPRSTWREGKVRDDRRRNCHGGRGGYRPDRRRPHRPGPGEASGSARTTDGHLSYFDANTNGKCKVVL